jgi:hypothetical protein
MAHLLQFPGSPTVRINGLDAEPDGELSVGLACRLYTGRRGLPSDEALHLPISSAKMQGRS